MSEQNTKVCQSCGMPMENSAELFATNADGSANEDYCIYCYKDNQFTADITMEQMIDFCVPHVVSGDPGMTEDAARQMMNGFFPTLKRWKE